MHTVRTALALAAAVVLASCSREEPVAYDVVEKSLSQISDDLAAGKVTSVALTNAYIARINAHDGSFRSVIAIAPDAMKQAEASDARRKDGKAIGPLDGVPILLKDNIDWQGMPTTAGSWALEQNMPARDSEVGRRLRAAGIVMLGKTNLDQYAGMRTINYINASTVGGGVNNPYRPGLSACGSSSGSGIAGAVSFAAGTVGTETSGSVVCPASMNGLVGIKPSIALVSRRGVVPISLTQDTTGPMTRTVRDLAMMLTVMAGSDAEDRWSADADAHKTDYVTVLDANALKGARLGVVRGVAGSTPATDAVLDKALDVMRGQGAEVVEVPISMFEDLTQEQRIILLYDFKEDINAYLASTPPSVKSRTLSDLIAFHTSDPRESMHAIDIFELSEKLEGGRQNPEYIKVLEYAKRRAGAEGIDRALSEYQVRALVSLTNGPAEAHPKEGTRMPFYPLTEYPKGSVPPDMTTYTSVAGYPNLSVPMGLVDGLPVGISFSGAMWSEADLIRLGYAYEQASKARVPPAPLQTARP